MTISAAGMKCVLSAKEIRFVFRMRGIEPWIVGDGRSARQGPGRGGSGSSLILEIFGVGHDGGYNAPMTQRFQFSLRVLLAAMVCAAFFFGGMAAQQAIDLREKRLMHAGNDELLIHERMLHLRLENAARQIERLPEGN
jgi:hypothetical protein